MHWLEMLKAGLGVMFKVEMNDGKIWYGWLDRVGLTQNDGEIILANKPPRSDSFTGKRLLIKNIKNAEPTAITESNF